MRGIRLFIHLGISEPGNLGITRVLEKRCLDNQQSKHLISWGMVFLKEYSGGNVCFFFRVIRKEISRGGVVSSPDHKD